MRAEGERVAMGGRQPFAVYGDVVTFISELLCHHQLRTVPLGRDLDVAVADADHRLGAVGLHVDRVVELTLVAFRGYIILDRVCGVGDYVRAAAPPRYRSTITLANVHFPGAREVR